MFKQLIAVVAVMAWSFGISFVIFKVIDVVMGLRVSEDDEEVGLDLAQHSETGYSFGSSGGRQHQPDGLVAGSPAPAGVTLCEALETP